MRNCQLVNCLYGGSQEDAEVHTILGKIQAIFGMHTQLAQGLSHVSTRYSSQQQPASTHPIDTEVCVSLLAPLSSFRLCKSQTRKSLFASLLLASTHAPQLPSCLWQPSLLPSVNMNECTDQCTEEIRL